MQDRSTKNVLSKRMTMALLCSLGLHWIGLTLLGHLIPEPNAKAPSEMSKAATELLVPLLSPEQRRKMIRPRITQFSQTPVKILPRKPKLKRPKPPARPTGQVVEIPPPADQRRPKKAKLLAAFNSTVKKEQVSSNNASPTPRMIKSDRRLISSGIDPGGSRTGRKRPPRGQTVTPENDTTEKKHRRKTVRQQKSNRKPGRKRLARRAKKKKQIGTLLPAGEGRFRPPNQDDSAMEPTEPIQQPNSAVAGGPQSWRTLLPTMGSKSMVQKDGSVDHLPDVDKGSQTFLNTREYKHSWFFNRVKRSVRQRWRAAETHRRHDPYGRVFGVRDRLTVVHVTLTQQGDLEAINVEKDSGVAMLDEAAIQAFQSAQPFPNPPSDLRDGDGRIRFKFGFFLEISGAGFRVFRPY
jgi:TonB family protein